MKKPLLAALTCFLVVDLAQAQQQPQFTQYGFNSLFLNPAYAGVKGYGELTSFGRYQYLGYNASFDNGGSPQTYLLSASLPLKLLGGGLGVVAYRDRIAESRMTTAGLAYSYHLKVGEATLGLGMQGTYTALGKGEFRPAQEGDPAVPLNSSDHKWDLNTGVWYEAEKLYAGLSVTNLLRSQYTFQNVRGNDSSQVVGENHAYLTAGYTFEATSSVTVTPTALVKMVLPGKLGDKGKFSQKNTSFELGARATLNEKYWAGVGYRHQESFYGNLGIALAADNALRIGYAFDFIAFNQDARALSSHEIMLSYRLPKPANLLRPAIRTPRYSF